MAKRNWHHVVKWNREQTEHLLARLESVKDLGRREGDGRPDKLSPSEPITTIDSATTYIEKCS